MGLKEILDSIGATEEDLKKYADNPDMSEYLKSLENSNQEEQPQGEQDSAPATQEASEQDTQPPPVSSPDPLSVILERLKALEERLSSLGQQSVSSPPPDIEVEPPIPPHLEIFTDKNLYDPENGVFGGISLSDMEEYDPNLLKDWILNRDKYYEGMREIEKIKNQHKEMIALKSKIRDDFKAKYNVDPDELENWMLKNRGLTYEDMYFLRKVDEMGGWNKFFANVMAQKPVPAPSPQPQVLPNSRNLPITNADVASGSGTFSASIEFPKSVEDYQKLTPQQKEQVQKMFVDVYYSQIPKLTGI